MTTLDDASLQMMDKISAIKQVNDGIIARLDEAKQTEVTQFKFILHDPLRISIFQWSEVVAVILDEWRNRHDSDEKKMQPIGGVDGAPFVLPTPFSTTIVNYGDLLRLNREYALLVNTVVDNLRPEKIVAYLKPVLHNMEQMHVLFGEIETTVFHPDNDIANATKMVDTIERCMGALLHMSNLVTPTQLHFMPKFIGHERLEFTSETLESVSLAKTTRMMNTNDMQFVTCDESFCKGIAMWRFSAETMAMAFGVHFAPSHAVVPLSKDVGFYGFQLNGYENDITSWEGTTHKIIDDNSDWDDGVTKLTLNCINCTLTIEYGDDTVHSLTLPPNKTWHPHFVLWSGSKLSLLGPNEEEDEEEEEEGPYQSVIVD